MDEDILQPQEVEEPKKGLAARLRGGGAGKVRRPVIVAPMIPTVAEFQFRRIASWAHSSASSVSVSRLLRWRRRCAHQLFASEVCKVKRERSLPCLFDRLFLLPLLGLLRMFRRYHLYVSLLSVSCLFV